MNNITVSVITLVYNHEHYLRKCIDGILSQKTDFKIELLIHDDASTDRSANIIKEYEACYPDLLKPIYQTENQFSKGVSIGATYIYPRVQSKYIALCEGDDYWTDPYKLQKQVDYMEKNADCYLCTHASYWEIDGELSSNGCQYEEERDLSTDEIIRNGGLYLATASLLFRRELLSNRPQWMRKADVGDYPLLILGSIRGRLHFLPQKMCVYRYQVPGSWTYNLRNTGINTKHLRTEIAWMELFDDETDHQYSAAVYCHLLPFYRELYYSRQLSLLNYLRALRKSQPRSFIKYLFQKSFGRLKASLKRLFGIQ